MKPTQRSEYERQINRQIKEFKKYVKAYWQLVPPGEGKIKAPEFTLYGDDWYYDAFQVLRHVGYFAARDIPCQGARWDNYIAVVRKELTKEAKARHAEAYIEAIRYYRRKRHESVVSR